MAQRTGVDVLVIEDEEHVAELLADVLGEEGYRVVIAPDGPQGLDYVARYRPRLVLCDLMLPGLSGLEIVQQLRATPGAYQPIVVLMSAAAPPRERPDDVQFISKPFSIDTLVQQVRGLLQPSEPDATR